jgi:hypothetical protein
MSDWAFVWCSGGVMSVYPTNVADGKCYYIIPTLVPFSVISS